MSGQQWEHLRLQIGTNDTAAFDEEMFHAGRAGFEVVAVTAVDRTLGLNSVTAVFKRPGAPQRPPEDAPKREPSWQPDPYGRHQHRLWRGYWTEKVADDGVESVDVP